MRRIITTLVLTLSFVFLIGLRPAQAADLGKGAAVFSANCAACHIGGKNVVNGAKTLKQEDLAKYGMDNIEAIKTQIMKGKAAMPAFTGRLSAEDIENVAAYVLSQAESGW
jgi:cytochrome c6